MGDSVYLLEIIHRLHALYPLLKTDVLSTAGNPLFPLFKDYQCKFGLKILKPLSPISYFQTVKNIKKEGYDIIFDFTGMPVNIPLMLLFVKSYKAGFNTAGVRKKSYDYVVSIEENIHIFDNYLHIIKPFLPITDEKRFTFFHQKPAEKTKNNAKKQRFISLVLSSNGGGNMDRRLPRDNSTRLINLIIKNFPGYKINLLGGPADYAYLDSLCGGLSSKDLDYDYANIVCVKKTKNIENAMEILEYSSLNICIDSGLMHISSLVNHNTYCLFGYSSPINSLPFNNIGHHSSDMDCSPCSFYKISSCQHLECMKKISPEEIICELRSRVNIDYLRLR